MVFVESQAVLGDHVELAAEDREGFAVDTMVGKKKEGSVWCDWSRMQQSHAAALYLNLPMRVAGSVDVRTRFVDFGMDGEGCCVDGLFTFYDLTVFVDEDEVAHADLGEVS